MPRNAAKQFRRNKICSCGTDVVKDLYSSESIDRAGECDAAAEEQAKIESDKRCKNAV